MDFLGLLELLKHVFLFLGYFSPSKTYERKLSKDEEAYYIKLLYENNDKDAKDILITHNLRLVAHVAKKYSSCNISQEDLLSIGSIGLIKGINTYSPDKGTKFASYVAKCIDNEILMAIRGESKGNSNVYFADVIGTDGEGNNITIADIIGEENEDVISNIFVEEESSKIYKLIDEVLNKREKEIIELRYGINGKTRLTQTMIGEKLNISRSYVSRIEKKAIEKLAKAYDKRVGE